MREEDRLFDFMKRLQPTPKCPRLRDETSSKPARLKVLSKGGSRQGQGPKVSKKARTPKKKPSLRLRKASSRLGARADQEERRKASSAPSP